MGARRIIGHRHGSRAGELAENRFHALFEREICGIAVSNASRIASTRVHRMFEILNVCGVRSAHHDHCAHEPIHYLAFGRVRLTGIRLP